MTLPTGKRPTPASPNRMYKMVAFRMLGIDYNHLLQLARENNCSITQYLNNLIVNQRLKSSNKPPTPDLPNIDL